MTARAWEGARVLSTVNRWLAMLVVLLVLAAGLGAALSWRTHGDRADAATRDAAELIGRDLTEHGYRVECALLQSVELDTRAWTEKERSVAFLLSGVLPARET